MTLPKRLGFIGTGTITAHIVRGLKASGLSDWPIVLSPRNAETAQALATSLPGVEIARDNQEVLDRADVVILALRPQVAEDLLRPLRFKPDTPIISLMATLHSDTLRAWTGATEICRAIPLPFVERRQDVIPVFPPHPDAMTVFGALGRALPVADLAAFDAYATASALMATYFGIIENAADWMQTQSISQGDAAFYLGALFSNLSTTLVQSPLPMTALRDAHSTPGGLNEQLHRVFVDQGGQDALRAGLQSVLARVKAAGAV